MNEFSSKTSLDKIVQDTLISIEKYQHLLNGYGLYNGLGSVLLFYGQTYLCTKDSRFICKIEKQLETLFSALNEANFPKISFAEGICGVGWLINFFVDSEILEKEFIKTFDNFDKLLSRIMIQWVDQSNYEFLYGASGIALYFLSKPLSKDTIKALESFVVAVDNFGIKINELEKKWNSKIRIAEDLLYGENISLSHGMSGLLVLLCKIYDRGILEEVTKTNIIQLSNYIISQRFVKKGQSIFPTLSLNHETSKVPSRLAWCYGDLGICIAISKTVDYSFISVEIIKVYEEILISLNERIVPAENGCIDPFICHGAAGVYYGLWKLNKINGMYFESTLFSWRNTLNQFKLDNYSTNSNNKNIGLIEGVIGVALVELTINTNISSWDECLLLS